MRPERKKQRQHYTYSYYERTPLHYACLHNRPFATISFLIRSGANVNAKDINGMSPLHIACAMNIRYATVAALIRAGAHVNVSNAHGTTPLHFACKEGNAHFVKALILAGAELNAKDKNGMSPMHSAYMNRDVIVILIASGANCMARNKLGRAAFYYTNTEYKCACLTDAYSIKKGLYTFRILRKSFFYVIKYM